jgi:hypothetical protein
MTHPLFLLLPFVLAATRSLAVGVHLPGESGRRPAIPVETEYEILLIVIFCLTGLVICLSLMFRFPDFGAVIAEYNQF